MKKLIYILLLAITLSSCNDWLDVELKSEIRQERIFSTEDGYKQVVIGNYYNMSQTGLYGGNLSMSLLDILAKYYEESNDLDDPFYYAYSYDYMNEKLVNQIYSSWSRMYSIIANVNSVLDNIDEDEAIFTSTNYFKVKAEALMQRAFLHFDLLRLYAPSPAMDNEAPGIPYVTTLQSSPFPQIPVGEVIEKVIGDIDEAITLFEHVEDEAYNKFYFTNVSARALKARVYLYANMNTLAFAEAKYVIENEDASLIDPNNPSWGSEDIFSLNVQNVESLTEAAFGRDLLKFDSDQFGLMYEGTDVRLTGWFKTDGGELKNVKYTQVNSLPLIRKGEMYLIAAECAETESEKVAFMNTFKTHRGLFELDDDQIADFETTLFDEYVREYISEGQLWFYYKRLNADETKTHKREELDWMTWEWVVKPIVIPIENKEEVYIFPIPVNELTYGEITREWTIN
ncbi:MAG: RagB/SusD family nutrient uptake outer membrane protein [Carboxylicivirga sp.]|jgi:hypothetical protein|nr:RagB/SusD family nutrient uptake outer membrane protein [Carboxylicivirga sp.]